MDFAYQSFKKLDICTTNKSVCREASLLDGIKMTENWLEFEKKNWQRWTLTLTLTFENDWKMDEFDRKLKIK